MLPDVTKAILPRLWRRRPFLDSSLYSIRPGTLTGFDGTKHKGNPGKEEYCYDLFDRRAEFCVKPNFLARNVRPAAYAGMIFMLRLPWAVLATIVAGAAGWTGPAIAYLAAYLVPRISVAWLAGVWDLHDQAIISKLWLLPVRDAITTIVWLVGLLSDRNQVERIRVFA